MYQGHYQSLNKKCHNASKRCQCARHQSNLAKAKSK